MRGRHFFRHPRKSKRSAGKTEIQASPLAAGNYPPKGG
nr:MAG TPA: hypothetical protein [Caudoviricetes sp.]